MTMYARNFIPTDSNCGDNIMKTNTVSNLIDTSVANQAPISQAPVSQAPVSRMIVRRGPQLMVVFSGYPQASTVRGLRQANVKIGLALAPCELATAAKLDDYSYVFVNVGRPSSSPLKRAVADLTHNGWSIDDSRISAPDLVEPRNVKTPIMVADRTMIQA